MSSNSKDRTRVIWQIFLLISPSVVLDFLLLLLMILLKSDESGYVLNIRFSAVSLVVSFILLHYLIKLSYSSDEVT